jgi:hypothetical protein
VKREEVGFRIRRREANRKVGRLQDPAAGEVNREGAVSMATLRCNESKEHAREVLQVSPVHLAHSYVDDFG